MADARFAAVVPDSSIPPFLAKSWPERTCAATRNQQLHRGVARSTPDLFTDELPGLRPEVFLGVGAGGSRGAESLVHDR